MKILSDPIEFEWDEGNKEKNWRKHGVSNKEAEEVFQDDDQPIIFRDESHSQKEERYGIYGKSSVHRLLTIFFTIRNNIVRIISASDMSKKERRAYEKIKKNSAV